MSAHHLVDAIARSAVHGAVYRVMWHSPPLLAFAIFAGACYLLLRRP